MLAGVYFLQGIISRAASGGTINDYYLELNIFNNNNNNDDNNNNNNNHCNTQA